MRSIAVVAASMLLLGLSVPLAAQDTGPVTRPRVLPGERAAPAPSSPGPAPQGLTATIYPGKTTVDFRWSGTEGAREVKMFRMNGKNAWEELTYATFADKSWARDSRATVGSTARYKVRAVYASGHADSGEIEVAVPAGPIGPRDLRAASNQPQTVDLSWACDPAATSYSLLRGKGTDPMDWIRAAGESVPLRIGECRYTDRGLYGGATYRYTVVARYPDPNSSAEASASVTLAP